MDIILTWHTSKRKLGKNGRRSGALQSWSVGYKNGWFPGCGDWFIGKMAFAQCDSPAGTALKINVVGNPLGGIAITVTWGEGYIEDCMAELFVAGLERWFVELVRESNFL